MLLVTALLGHRDDAAFRDRRVEQLPVAYDEAGKRRLRRRTTAGTDVAISLDSGAYLADGAVLHDDGARVIVVRRTETPSLVIQLDPTLPAAQLVEQAASLGHVFGNQHVPVEVEGTELRVPLTTSEEIARGAIGDLPLHEARIEARKLPLGARRPLRAGHGHGPRQA
jgi:urease accessory protein